MAKPGGGSLVFSSSLIVLVGLVWGQISTGLSLSIQSLGAWEKCFFAFTVCVYQLRVAPFALFSLAGHS